jgi:hypothetical protein
MKLLPITLLRDREAFWAKLREGNLDVADLVSLVVFIALACGLYGAVLAGWRSPMLILYVAIKLPILFLGTSTIVSVFNWMASSAFGSRLEYRATVFIVLGAMTIAAWILLGLVPVALFLLLSGVSYTGTHEQLQYAHNSILLTHIVILSLAGLGGNIALFKGLRSVVHVSTPVTALFVVWQVAFTFVGCQMSWILRPFVGSPFFPVVFMRSDCLSRNFYQFVFLEVFPFLLAGNQ